MTALIGPTVEETIAAELRDINWRLDFVQQNSSLAESVAAELTRARDGVGELIDALLGYQKPAKAQEG